MDRKAKLWGNLGRAAAIVATLALVLASVAGAANRNVEQTASAPDATHGSVFSDFVGSVTALLSGDTSPARTVERSGRGKDSAGTTRTTITTTTETTNGSTIGTEQVSSPTALGNAPTTNTRPGWGCGDTNHKHSGPPGNPGATSPCNKNK